MTTRLTFPASMFSVVCQRCGSTLRKNADSCPNCGADRAAAFGEERTKERVKEPSGMFSMASASAPLASEPVAPDWAAPDNADSRPQPEFEADPDVLPESEGWSRRKTAIAAVCTIGLLAGGVAYLMHDSTDEEPAAPSTQHSASGSIDSKSGGYVQSDSPPVSLPPAVAAAIDKVVPTENRPLSTGDAVLAARGAMEQHDLMAARTRLKGISPSLQSRPDVQRLKDELAQHELERDAALQLARACEKTSAWACVQQNAGEALAIDGSNTESQAMLERVISHAGWLAGTPPIAALKKKAAPAAAPAPAVATTPPVTSATDAIMSAIPSTAPPAPSAVFAPAPAPAPQAKVAAAKPAAAPPKPSVASAQPAETRATARESRRSSAYARSAPATDSSTNSVKVMPAPAISPPILSTSPSTASVHPATPAAATTPTTPSTRITSTAAAMTPPPAVVTTTVTAPAPAPVATKAPSYGSAQAPVPARATPTAVAATTPTRAAATYGASATDVPTTGNADDIERAIKQFGWSGGDSMPKAAR
ncbi:hypothetical protein AWB67_03354 [Caballeronia terrestris]|uniref:Zinc-ribbon domain-containing protein n=1 Tax=Caballeronia terrestris TaxID=1226301 RepID=A0A158J688_9BURK|nr:zinc ribbon domain-containing protein [Caballeronia terrestris]SAL63830.1 hypothetical protein AWB67_03354 [Caballeronia terrestris]